jgi:FdhD protein
VAGEKKINLYRIIDGELSEAQDFVALEEAVMLHVNGRELVTLLYTPPMALELALGYMLSEGVISARDDVKSFSMKRGAIFVELSHELPDTSTPALRTLTSGCGGGITFTYPHGLKDIVRIKSDMTVTWEKIEKLGSLFRKGSALFEKTGGVHSAALSDGEEFLAMADDIGRHNAVDKVFGRCLLDGTDMKDNVLFTTGRISSEILIKCAKRGVPLIVSRGAPTSLAVSLAEKLGVTVAGFVRGRRMNVYTHPERVII